MTEAAERYPHKRLVAHYMQPHYPFVPAGTTVDKEHLRQIDSDGDGSSADNVWNQMFHGDLDLSRDKLWSISIDNLEYVLEYVAEILDGLSGKTVVTADHGNYVGKRASPILIREYGHPRGVYDDPVVQVPWLTHENGSRRKIHVMRLTEQRLSNKQLSTNDYAISNINHNLLFTLSAKTTYYCER
jgi:hypothetical protein